VCVCVCVCVCKILESELNPGLVLASDPLLELRPQSFCL
jgi:hypothetical protein